MPFVACDQAVRHGETANGTVGTIRLLWYRSSWILAGYPLSQGAPTRGEMRR